MVWLAPPADVTFAAEICAAGGSASASPRATVNDPGPPLAPRPARSTTSPGLTETEYDPLSAESQNPPGASTVYRAVTCRGPDEVNDASVTFSAGPPLRDTRTSDCPMLDVSMPALSVYVTVTTVLVPGDVTAGAL